MVLSWEAWLTLAVLILTIAALTREALPPSSIVLGAVVILLIAGIIDAHQAFSGFSNPAPITVAALYVLARAVERTGALQPIARSVLGEAERPRWSLARLLVPTAAASAFLNNTPIVAMLAPQVTDWADRRGASPSRYLMPLSFAAILGGVVTVIGTSTNLVVSGLLEAAGQAPLGFFEITRIGLPLAVAGLVLILLLAPLVLPERRSARRELSDEAREFVVSMEVVPSGPLDGKAVEEGGLRHLQGVYLVEIERGSELIAPVTPTTVLRGRDRLTFVGRADLIVDLHTAPGLVSAEQRHLVGLDSPHHTFFEAVVGASSPLLGKTLREASFRSRYQAAAVAIHRSGQRVRAKLGEVRLRLGDTILLLSDPGFRERWYDRNDFLLVSRLGGTSPTANRKAWLVGLVAVAIVVVAGGGFFPILHASLAGAILLVAFGVLTPGEARRSVDLDVIILIAAAFGLAAAIQVSGLADALAMLLVSGSKGLGVTGALFALVAATILLTELITNNAAAALMFPIALSTAASLGVDPRPLALAVAVAASASFLTPIGYQTNTMVYGPGGYRFQDYSRLGLPLTVLVLALTVFLVPRFWPG